MLLRNSIQSLSSSNTAKSRWLSSGVLQKSSVGGFRAIRTILSSQLQHKPVREFAFGGAFSSSHASPLFHAARCVQYETSAANFDTQVLQSEQAVCLVYFIRNTNCMTFLRQAEELVDKINAETSGAAHENEAPRTQEDKNGKKTLEWLKLCTINADENRNLASAFSVERAKLPVTYFIMQGTIIDKVVGHIAPTRLHAILYKFLEHYQKEMNVDLLARTNKEASKSGGLSNPIPAAATADLLDSASTSFIQEKMLSALAGADMIRLPEDANLLDGIRKTLQQAKKKAHQELQELHRELGMGIRRLPDAELHIKYYKSTPFHAMAVISALEALFLARSYAFLGDISKTNVIWAKQSIHKEFEPVLGDAKMRRILALVDANLVKGDLRLSLATHRRKLQDPSLSSDVQKREEGGETKDAEGPLKSSTQEENAPLEANAAYFGELMAVIDDHIDTRDVGEGFPDAVVERLLEKLKEDVKLRKLSGNISSTSSSPSSESSRSLTRSLAEERVEHTKTVLTCILNLFAADPKGSTARSRLASILY